MSNSNQPTPSPDDPLLIPFGHYDGMGDAEAPHNEVMVGREEQRAIFMDLLETRERKGSVLVTGGRGAGKTSFVIECIRQYEKDAYNRFVRNPFGKEKWDRALLAVLVAAALFAVFFLVEFLQLWIDALPSAPTDTNAFSHILRYKLIFLGLLIGLVPVAAGIVTIVGTKSTLGEAQKKKEGESRSLSSTGWGAPILLLRALAMILFGLWLMSPLQPLLEYLMSENNGTGVAEQSSNNGISTSSDIKTWLSANSDIVEFEPAQCNSDPQEIKVRDALLGGDTICKGIDRNPYTAWEPKNSVGPWTWAAELSNPASISALTLHFTECGKPDLIQVELKSDKTQTAQVVARRDIVVAGSAPSISSAATGTQSDPIEVDFGCLISGVEHISITMTINSLESTCNPYYRKELARSDGFMRKPGLAEVILKGCVQPTQLSCAEAEKNLLPPNNGGTFQNEFIYIAWILFALIVFYLLEQRCILNPAWDKRATKTPDQKKTQQSLAELTLPYQFHRMTQPVRTVRVNLAFEELDHRQVIHSMLTGLRDTYEDLFSGWRHPLRWLTLGVQLTIATILSFSLCSFWFDLMPRDNEIEDNIRIQSQGIYSYCSDVKPAPAGLKMLCHVTGETVARALYFDLLRPPKGMERPGKNLRTDKRHIPKIIQIVLPFSEGVGIVLRLYHMLFLLLAFAFVRGLSHRFGLARYRRILEQIDEALDELWSTTKRSFKDDFPLAQYVPFFPNERTEEKQRQPVDSRIAEMRLLTLLSTVQNTHILLPFGIRLSFPAPELIFVFDELDKVGLRAGGELLHAAPGSDQNDSANLERARSKKIHRLLSDMKNVISSAPARFIFIGGRNLHDEWLADQTEREPLLSTVFVDEVYVPSLLVEPGQTQMMEPIQKFVEFHHKRANELWGSMESRRDILHRPVSVSPPVGDRHPLASFLQGIWHRSISVSPITFAGDPGSNRCALSVYRKSNSDTEEFKIDGKFATHYYKFLAYRSLGNPKKLKELLERQIMPVKHIFPGGTQAPFDTCDHVLKFDRAEQFEVELLSEAYDLLDTTFGMSLKNRDDKLATGIFYLTDFMFKFHRRAFTWANLDRVDELSHIHRAPDLRKVLEQLVNAWSERSLHTLRNGLYDFRFRADYAREVQFISRQSELELAAFNFTLDESHGLKSQYLLMIRDMKEDVTAETLSALGELHEFDQDYEHARHYYDLALRRLDKTFERVMGQKQKEENEADDSPLIRSILKGTPNGLDAVRRNSTWAIARLRLMLQVGMTFEISRNMESAEVAYRDAHTLSNSILMAMLDNTGREAWAAQTFGPQTTDKGEWPTVQRPQTHRLHVLKHMNILFQPIFAEAWIKEKLPGGVDTSTAVVEEYLNRLTRMLPGVRSSREPTQHANFLLIMAELHNKAGDLYFFKGTSMNGPGFLGDARYHYLTSLAYLGKYIESRDKSTELGDRIELGGQNDRLKRTWPDFVVRAVAGAMLDLGETIAALRYGNEDYYTVEQLRPIPVDKREAIAMILEVVHKKTVNSVGTASYTGLEIGSDFSKKVREYAIKLLDMNGYHPDAIHEQLLLDEEQLVHGKKPDTSAAGRIDTSDGSAFQKSIAAALNGTSSTNAYPVLARLLYFFVQQTLNSSNDTPSESAEGSHSLHSRERPESSIAGNAGVEQVPQNVEIGPIPEAPSISETNRVDPSVGGDNGGVLPIPDGVCTEFQTLYTQYDAPFLFPPLYAGLIYKAFNETVLAKKEFQRSIQMVTMGKAFYDLTPDLYYLYDDFNDRRTHFVHAMQMMMVHSGEKR